MGSYHHAIAGDRGAKGVMEHVTKNCHYISRFLTSRWEEEASPQGRMLAYFDFGSRQFARASSRRLYAEESINSQAVETWLSKVVESPFGECRARLSAADPTALARPEAIRAAMLLIWLQGARVSSIDDLDSRRHLDSLASMPIEDVDWLVAEIGKHYRLASVTTGPEPDGAVAPLFVPSTGVFSIVAKDSGCQSGHSFVLALPIDLNCALIAIPQDRAGTVDLTDLPRQVSNYSVGTSTSRRVVLLPSLLTGYSEAELADRLTALRQVNDLLRAKVEEGREIVVGAYASQGLDAPRDQVGRIPPT